MASIGKQILNALKHELNEVEYRRYIHQLHFDQENSRSDLAIFCAPNPLIARWIHTRYSSKMATLFESRTGIKPHIRIITSNLEPEVPKALNTGHIEGGILNASYTFENFVMGESNHFACVTAKSVSQRLGHIYNPLFLHGGVGLGKTHLMHAIGHVALEQGKRVVYTSVEQFLNDFSRHLQLHTMDQFKEKYRTCDLLLIDDIQFLSGKPHLQEEFFHTFESLRNASKQIVITSDKHPKKIDGLEERLKSRFEWGLIADIQPPQLETKIAIIRKKGEINAIKLTQEVIHYIATIIQSNTREIEGILSKLNAYSHLMGVEITLDFAQSVLKEQLFEQQRTITIDLIIEAVARELGIKPSEIRSKSRNKTIVYARRIAIYLSRSLTQTSMPRLSQYFGMKDHTAVSHTMKKIQELRQSDPLFRSKIEELTLKISGTTPP